MQKELAAEGLPTALQLGGVNEAGEERDNAAMCNGRDLPWLQDVADQSVWSAWKVSYRDVIVLDAENRPSAIFNLVQKPLDVLANYAELKELLRNAALAAATE